MASLGGTLSSAWMAFVVRSARAKSQKARAPPLVVSSVRAPLKAREPNTNPRCAFAHPLGPRYVPLLLVYPPRPLRTFASLNAHLQVHLGLGGKPRSGLRPHSLNRAASPCCGLRTSSGRFDALAVQRKAMRCPSAAISQRYCSKHPPQLCQRSSGMQTAACIGRVRNALRRSWANQVLRMAIGLRPQGATGIQRASR